MARRGRICQVLYLKALQVINDINDNSNIESSRGSCSSDARTYLEETHLERTPKKYKFHQSVRFLKIIK